MIALSALRVAARFLAANQEYRVWVDDDGYSYEDPAIPLFIGEEYADSSFDLRNLPRSHPSFPVVRAYLEYPPERRVQLALAAAAEGDARSAHFLLESRTHLLMTSRQAQYLFSLGAKHSALADKMPDYLDPLPTKRATDVVALKTRRKLPDWEATRLAPYFQVTQEGPVTVLRSLKLNPDLTGAPPPPTTFTPEQVQAQLATLDLLLQKVEPASEGFVRSIRSQMLRGKKLTDKQLAAVRRQLYMVEMRPEADLFRPPS